MIFSLRPTSQPVRPPPPRSSPRGARDSSVEPDSPLELLPWYIFSLPLEPALQGSARSEHSLPPEPALQALAQGPRPGVLLTRLQGPRREGLKTLAQGPRPGVLSIRLQGPRPAGRETLVWSPRSSALCEPTTRSGRDRAGQDRCGGSLHSYTRCPYKTLSSRGVVDSPRVLLRLPLLRPQLRSSHYRSPSWWRSLVLLIYSEVGLALSTPRFALIGGQNPMFGLLCLSAGLCFLSVGLCFGLIYSAPVSTTAGCS